MISSIFFPSIFFLHVIFEKGQGNNKSFYKANQARERERERERGRGGGETT